MKKILMLSVLLIQAAYAEKIILEYNDVTKNQSVDIDGAASIDVVTGDIKVSPINEVFVVPSQAAVIGINASEYQVDDGQSITVNWEVAYGDTCFGTTEAGSSSGWAGALDSSVGMHSKIVTLNSLPATLRITCKDFEAYNISSNSVKDLVISKIDTSVQTPADIIYFRAGGSNNSTLISQPSDVVISWNVSNGTTCQASSSPSVSDWNHSFNPNSLSSKSVNIQETTTLTLTCGGDSMTVQVILDDNIPSGCSSSVYPSPNLNIRSYTYNSIRGHDFGVETNGSATLSIENTDFASMKFTAPTSTTFRRTINLIPAPPSARKIRYTTFSISTCPGDYSQAAVCVFTKQSGSSIKISTDPSVSSSYCKINAGQEYYMNFVNKEDPNSASPPECLDTSHTSCAVLFSEGAL